MKFAYWLFFLLLVGGGRLFGQATVLPNPSSCGNLGNIRDYSCPEEGGFYQPTRFLVRVAGAPGRKLGVDVYLREVRLIVTHTWLSDLEIRLESPSGKSVLLAADKGGGEDNLGIATGNCGQYAVFSTVACTPLPEDSGAPFTDQPYQPQESLLGLNSDGSSPIGDWKLLICDDTEQDTGRLEFVELVFEPISCLPVGNVRLLGQDSTTLLLSWDTGAGNCTDSTTWLEYGPRGFQPGTGALPGTGGTLLRAGCPPYVLGNLQPQTNYDIYIRKQCGPGVFSANACPLPVQTLCLPPGPHTEEQFSSATPCAPSCGAPCNWSGVWTNADSTGLNWTLYSGKTPTEGTGPSDAVDPGGKYIYVETSGSACKGSAVLMSGCFELQKRGQADCHLSFFYHLYGVHIGSLRLEASADGVRWDALWQLQGDQGPQWRKALVSLQRYPDGSLLRFRFVGTPLGTGSLGDMALDAIVVHGSTYLGSSAQTYYADRDGDGYGNPAETASSCLPSPPAGFVARSGDCDDRDAGIWPGAPEIPCDGKDNNCNGMADDRLLPAPQVFSDTVCAGERPLLSAVPVQGEYVLWYTSADTLSGALAPEGFSPPLPEHSGSEPLVYRFYAQAVDAGFRCFSSPLTEVQVVVNPRPIGVFDRAPAFCAGDSVNLARLGIRDGRNTQSVLTFHSALPASAVNRLTQLTLRPDRSLALAYRMESPAGCTFSDTFTVEKRVFPAIVFLPSDSFALCTGSSRTVAAKLPPDAGPYRYLWGNGAETPLARVVGGPEAGQRQALSLTLTDGYGCTGTDTLVAVTISSMDSLQRQVFDVSACNAGDGRIELRPLDGVPPFNYAWSGSNGSSGTAINVGTATFTIPRLAQGSYRVTITDSSNEKCAFVMPAAYVNGPGTAISSVTVQDATCAGSATGSICVKTSGAGAPDFLWSNGEKTPCASGLTAGTYSLTLTQSGCATVLKDLVVADPAPLKVVASAKRPSCTGSRDGAIAITPFGGGGSYRYRWNTGRLTRDLDGLSAGIYVLTTTDVYGCSTVDTVRVEDPPPLEIQVEELKKASCAGGRDGWIRVAGKGGTAPYAYLWQQGGSAPVWSGLAAGTYRVTLTDYLGCQTSRQLVLANPPPLAVVPVQVALPVCQGDSSGVLTLQRTGGQAPYQTVWSTGTVADTLRRVTAGRYWAVVTDANLCHTDTLFITVRPPVALSWNPQVTNPLCRGRNDGTIRLAPVGRQPFQVQWARGDTTASVASLPEGLYPVQVRDALGCRYDTVFELKATRTTFQVIANPVAPTCSGGKDGFIFIQSRTVEFPPLRYFWSDGSTSRDRSGLPEGSYPLRITDALGCTQRLDSLELKSPPPLTYKVLGRGNNICKGDSTGFIELEISGGQAPYRYLWEGTSATGASAYRLKAGTYEVFVEDVKGCALQAGFQVLEPSGIEAQVLVRTGDICKGDTVIQVGTAVSGGVPPYRYRWSNSSTDSTLYNPRPGDYALLVRDANGCGKLLSSIKVKNLGQPLKLAAFEAEDISCYGAKDGQLYARISGGTAPFSYVFSGTSQVVRSLKPEAGVYNLGIGANYSVVVTDALGCQVASGVQSVREPRLLEAIQDSILQAACTGQERGGVFVSARGGTVPYAFNWFDEKGVEISISEDLVGVRSGAYRLILTDSRLCTDTLRLSIGVGNPVSLNRAVVTPVACKGGSSGSVSLDLTGGRPPFKIWWNGQPGSLSATGLKAGSYQPLILDADSCRTVLPAFEVKEAQEPLQAQAIIVPVSCSGRSDGEVALRVTGGIPPYAFVWTDTTGKVLPNLLPHFKGLAPGGVRLVLRDSFACVQNLRYDVPLTPALALSFEVRPPNSMADGQIQANVVGGTPPFRYAWSTGDSLSLLKGISPGAYGLTVTDSRACTAQDTAKLLPSALSEAIRPQYVRLYPNPSPGVFWLDMAFEKALPSVEWTLSDLYGRVWRSDRAVLRQNRFQERFDCSGLPEGMYLLGVQAQGLPVWTGRLVLKPGR